LSNNKLFVVTGGFRCSQEIARQIIQEQIATNGDALPRANTLRYTELMLARSIAAYRENTPSPEIVFMDRGIPDVACYARLIHLPLFDDLQVACETCRYNQIVFMAPPWEQSTRPTANASSHTRRQSRPMKGWPRCIKNSAIGLSNYGCQIIIIMKKPARRQAEAYPTLFRNLLMHIVGQALLPNAT